MNRIILASNSPRRKELLKLAGLEFVVDAADIDENIGQEDPEELVKELSYRKAYAVAGRHPDAVIIAADTVVALEDTILGKPADPEEAKQMLSLLSGRTHRVLTGVTILMPESREPSQASGDDGRWEQKTFCEMTEVTFYNLTDEEMESYIATGEPMDKAGAYGIQGKGALLVKRISGDYNNVVGLPLARLWRVLQALQGC